MSQAQDQFQPLLQTQIPNKAQNRFECRMFAVTPDQVTHVLERVFYSRSYIQEDGFLELEDIFPLIPLETIRKHEGHVYRVECGETQVSTGELRRLLRDGWESTVSADFHELTRVTQLSLSFAQVTQ